MSADAYLAANDRYHANMMLLQEKQKQLLPD